MLRAKYQQLHISFDALFAQIHDLVIKALITIEPHICNKLRKANTQRNQCFDLFGFDVLVDDTLRPWLLEVNMCPSLSCSARLDKQIKTTLLADVFHLIGLQPFSHVHPHDETVPMGNLNLNRDRGGVATAGERVPNFNPYLDEITESSVLSERDLDILISLDEELRR
jgi:hypothetical protein